MENTSYLKSKGIFGLLFSSFGKKGYLFPQCSIARVLNFIYPWKWGSNYLSFDICLFHYPWWDRVKSWACKKWCVKTFIDKLNAHFLAVPFDVVFLLFWHLHERFENFFLTRNLIGFNDLVIQFHLSLLLSLGRHELFSSSFWDSWKVWRVFNKLSIAYLKPIFYLFHFAFIPVWLWRFLLLINVSMLSTEI